MLRLLLFLVGVAAAACATGAASAPGDPYRGGLDYAACMREHGVPHPDPDRKGDFSLTPAQEAQLRAVGRAKVEAADAACFHFIKPFVSTKPLSEHAKAQARSVLQQVRTCMNGAGYKLGPPTVENMSRGRAMFGFQNGPSSTPITPAMNRAQHACENEVGLAKKLDVIIAVDRAPV
jgi:hypothetical protein